MPIFEYKCNHCKETTDKIVTFNKRKDPILCSKCNGSLIFQEKPVLGSFQLKGKGWYETDFKEK